MSAAYLRHRAREQYGFKQLQPNPVVPFTKIPTGFEFLFHALLHSMQTAPAFPLPRAVLIAMKEVCKVPLRRCAMLVPKQGAGSMQCHCWRRSGQFCLIWEHDALSMVSTTFYSFCQERRASKLFPGARAIHHCDQCPLWAEPPLDHGLGFACKCQGA